MLKMKALSFSLVVFFVIVLAISSKSNVAEVHLTGRTMGTTYNVKYSESKNISGESLQKEIDQLLVLINQKMSTYDPESELSHFNKWRSVEPFLLSAQTLEVMSEAKRLGQLSEGVLDVTLGPLVNLWGFGPDAKPEKIPTRAEVDAVQAQIGLDKLILSDTHAIKRDVNLYVDLSTIAKGYAVDEVAELLESHGLINYLVEIGGEMRVAGIKANEQSWRIAVEKPVTTERGIQRILTIGDNAIATSGDYRNYFELDGVRYSHLIDPRTGFPIQHNLVAVTVVHPSSMTADGLATALNVMGKDQALIIAEKNNLAVLLITRENGEFKEYTSANFSQYVQTQ